MASNEKLGQKLTAAQVRQGSNHFRNRGFPVAVKMLSNCSQTTGMMQQSKQSLFRPFYFSERHNSTDIHLNHFLRWLYIYLIGINTSTWHLLSYSIL